MNAATVPWIILFAPLLSASLILFFGKYSRTLSAGLAIGAALLSSALSWWLFFQPGEVGPNQVLLDQHSRRLHRPHRHDRRSAKPDDACGGQHDRATGFHLLDRLHGS